MEGHFHILKEKNRISPLILTTPTAHPTDPSLLGLKNLAQFPWNADMPGGAEKSVEPGKNVRVAKGVKIDFGVLKGFIE